jgi:hypothetical protein
MDKDLSKALNACNRSQIYRVILFFFLLNAFEFFYSSRINIITTDYASAWIFIALKLGILLKFKSNWNILTAVGSSPNVGVF